jgi:type VI secretion system protein ImpA
VDPRADTTSNSLYYKTKDARNAARSAERAAVEMGGPVPEEWDTVADTAMIVLSTQSKDLEVAAWLVEALLRQEGFPGLRDGLKVITGIVTNFWDSSFPELDEDGVEGKVSSIAGLSGAGAIGTLIQPIRLVPLTHGSMSSYSLWNYEQATDLEKIADAARKQERINNGAVTMAQFEQSVAETPVPYLVDILNGLEEALASLAEMDKTFDAVAGVDAPPVSALREMLEQVAGAVRHFGANKLALAVSQQPDEIVVTEGVAATADGGSPAGTVVQVRRVEGYATRDDALAELTRISAYFRKTEPHSPISYTLDDAVRRARLTLPELLSELAEDPIHIQRILIAAGIKPPQPA